MTQLIDDQVRLVLEQQCAKLFRVLVSALPPGASATLLFIDYGEAGERFKNTAYITALTKPELITTVEALVQRWKCGSTGTVLHDPAVHGWVPGGPMLEGLGRLIRPYVPAGVGFALLFGKRDGAQYLSTCDREGMATLLETELLPAWRREAGSA